MANPIFEMFNKNQSTGNSGPFGNMMNTMKQFQQFRNNFQGDPKQMVYQLLQSGRMSQKQFNQLQQMATQFQNLTNQK